MNSEVATLDRRLDWIDAELVGAMGEFGSPALDEPDHGTFMLWFPTAPTDGRESAIRYWDDCLQFVFLDRPTRIVHGSFSHEQAG